MKVTSMFGLGTALAIAALVGCGGNSSGGGFTTSVPSGTKLTSLTPQQAMQLCTDFDAYGTAALTPDLCKLVAIEATALSLSFSSTGQPSDAMLQMTCTQTYNGCLSGDGGVTTTSGCEMPAIVGHRDGPLDSADPAGRIRSPVGSCRARSRPRPLCAPRCLHRTSASRAGQSGVKDAPGSP